MKSNKVLRSAIVLLERSGRGGKSGVWRDAAKLLASGTVTWPEVNLSRLESLGDDATTVFVPGKVLGTGSVDRKLTVGAFAFSASARKKIEAAGGKTLTVEEFVKKHPEGSGVTLVR